MIKIDQDRRVLNYVGLFLLILFNLAIAGFLAHTGKKLIDNTKKSQILEVSKDARNEMLKQKR